MGDGFVAAVALLVMLGVALVNAVRTRRMDGKPSGSSPVDEGRIETSAAELADDPE
jgi:hypothetical protein